MIFPLLDLEQTAEKVAEMTLESDQDPAPKVEKPKVDVPLVGGVGVVNDDSDSDSEPAVDIDDYELEEDDPVGYTFVRSKT